MRWPLLFSALLFTLSTFPDLTLAQGTATTTVTANPATVTVGGTVGLSATVQPNPGTSGGKTIDRPTGSITFFDGSTPLSSTPIGLTPDSYTSATFPQAFGTPDPTLTTPNPSSPLLQGELAGDLNNDGVLDLLIYNYTSPQYSVQTFSSDGKGGYTTSAVQTFNFPGNASNPEVNNIPQLIDLNGDGTLDLLCGLLVAYGNGDGTFAQAVPVPFLSSGFVTSYAADLNGDGKADILAVDTIPYFPLDPGPLQFAVTVFLNHGAGSFTSAGTFPVTPPLTENAGFAGLNFFPPTFADLNGDGKLDLIVQTQTIGATQIVGAESVDVLLNNGDGTFGTYMPVSVPNPPDYSFGLTPYQMACGDVNGDGKQDLILTLAGTGADLNAMILLGNGDGTFQAPLYLPLNSAVDFSPSETPSIVVQDFNLDGKPDLIFGNGELALGNGDGTFVLSSPLFPLQVGVNNNIYLAFPLAPITLSGNLAPSLVYLLPTVTPPAASVFTPQISSSGALSITTLAVGTHTVTARYSGDANYAADSSASVTVTVNQAVSATAAKSSVNPSFAGQSVTLTANVTSNGPTPTGNVIFTSGSTTLATVALSAGSAAYTTTSFTTVGKLAITASYSGDANTQASSASLSQVIDAAFTMEPADNGSTILTVQPGQTVSAPINVTGATGFSGQVTFTCSGLPANASCSFSPATITVSGTAVVPTLLTVNTAASTTTARLILTYGLALASPLLVWPIRRRRVARLWTMLIFAITCNVLGLAGCNGGGSNTPPEATPGTYKFTVTASSGSVQIQSSYTLVVQ